MYKCVPSDPGAAAGVIINPPKSAEQVATEAQEGHQSYIRSHNAYFVGEYCGHLSLFGSDSVQMGTSFCLESHLYAIQYVVLHIDLTPIIFRHISEKTP